MPPYTFLPSLQAAVAGRAVPPEDGATRRRIRLGVQVLADGAAQGAPHHLEAELLGAGDVVSLDPSVIAGVEPSPGSRAVEPNYFPYVEFADADLPWRYSLDTGPPTRLRPWLLLVALGAAEFRYLGRGAGPLPRIEVFDAAISLPDPDQSWAHAHVQVARAVSGEDLRQRLNSAPEGVLARVLCPRRLDDNTAYTLFLVPMFDAGRRVGIGARGPAAPWDAYAWDVSASGPVELPFYREWKMRTSTLEDFESLVRRLRPLPPGAGSPAGGTRTVFAGRPGYYDDVDEPSLTFEAEGALQRVGFRREPPLIERTTLTPRLERTLTAVAGGDTPADEADGPDREDPLVALPVYGRHFAEPEAIDADADTMPWVHEVNLDPRLRLAAGAGARIVRRHQEQLMEKCWAQAGEIQRANRLRAGLQLSTRLTGVLADRHLNPLPPGVAGQIATPLLHTVQTPFGGDRTIRADLRVRGVPSGRASVMVRRLAAKRPDVAGPRAEAARIRAAEPVGGLVAERLAVPTEAELRRATRRVEARRAAVADVADLPRLIPQKLAPVQTISFDRPSFEVGPVDSGRVAEAVVERIRELPVRKAADLVAGATEAERASLEPIMRGPRVPIPLAPHLPEEDADHLLSGVGELPDNCVILVEENTAFIEALLSGANHEMNRELRWREFPTDMRGSPLTRFWSSGHPPGDEDGDDVEPLALWDGHAGTHFRRTDRPRLTLVVHGDLVRRYPDLVVVANHQVIPGGRRWTATRGSTAHPVFTGVLGDTTALFGFDLTVDEVRAALDDYYFVLYEPVSRFRFGLDIATHGLRTARRRLGRAAMPFPLATLVPARRAVRIRSVAEFWGHSPEPVGPVPRDPDDLSWEHVTLDDAGYVDLGRSVTFADGSDLLGPARTSASIAQATLQRPICAVVPARRMLPDV